MNYYDPDAWPVLGAVFLIGAIVSGLIVGLWLKARSAKALASWSHRYQFVETSRNEAIDKIAALQAQLNASEKYAADLARRIDAAETGLSAAETETARLKSELDASAAARIELERESQSRGDRLAELDIDLGVLQAKLSDIEADKQDLIVAIDRLKADVSRHAADADERARSLTTARFEIERLEKQNANISERLSERRSAQQRDALAFATLRAEREADEKRIEDLVAKLSEFDRESLRLRNAIEERDERITQLEQELKGTRYRVPQLEQQLIARNHRLADLEAELSASSTNAGEFGRAQARIREQDALIGRLNAIVEQSRGARRPQKHADDLKRIKGVGPKLEGILNDLGIYHYRQIARFSPEDIERIDRQLESFRGRIERDGWIDQSIALHREYYGENP